MTKLDIITEISQKEGVEAARVRAVVEAFMEEVKKSLTVKNDVYLRGFGCFTRTRRARKVARNITKGTTIVIPEHDIPVFRPYPAFRNALNDNSGSLQPAE